MRLLETASDSVACDARIAQNSGIAAAQNQEADLFAGTTRALKKTIKKQLKVLRHRYTRTFHSFTPDELSRELRLLGLDRGDAVLVHSSFDAFGGFTGKPTDVIEALQSAIGPDGALLMPDRKSTRLNSSHTVISYAVFCLKKKNH